MATKPTPKAKPAPAPKADPTDAPEAPVTTSQDGYTLSAALDAAIKAGQADPEAVQAAESYLAVFAASAPGDRLAANVAKKLKQVKGLPA